MVKIKDLRYRLLGVLRRHPLVQTWTLLSPSATWLFLFVVVPAFIVLYYSFLTRGEWGQTLHIFTLENYQRISKLLYLKILWRSLRLAILSSLICLLIGYPVSYWIAFYGGQRRNLLIFLIIIPSWSSFLVRIYAWLFLLRDTGVVNNLLLKLHVISSPITMLYNEPGVLAGLVYTYLPFMILPLYASLVGLDRSVLEAALDLGATPLARLVRITAPLTKGGIISGSVLVFIPVLGEYLVPNLLGGAKVTMVGNLIADKFLVFRNWPFGSALSIIIMFIVLSLIFIYMRISGGKGLFEEL